MVGSFAFSLGAAQASAAPIHAVCPVVLRVSEWQASDYCDDGYEQLIAECNRDYTKPYDLQICYRNAANWHADCRARRCNASAMGSMLGCSGRANSRDW
jgi:hypothetical protein